MKNKTTPGETKTIDAAPVSHNSIDDRERSHLVRIFHYKQILFSITGLASAVLSIAAALASSRGVSLVFSDLPQIPQAYASLIGIVISSVVGISATFLVVRFIYQKRKSETEEVFHRVRSKEKNFFEALDLDFGRIIKRRELDAGQTN